MFTATIFIHFPTGGVYNDVALASLTNALRAKTLDEVKSKAFDYVNTIVKHIDECLVSIFFEEDGEYIDMEQATYKGGEMCDD